MSEPSYLKGFVRRRLLRVAETAVLLAAGGVQVAAVVLLTQTGLINDQFAGVNPDVPPPHAFWISACISAGGFILISSFRFLRGFGSLWSSQARLTENRKLATQAQLEEAASQSSAFSRILVTLLRRRALASAVVIVVSRSQRAS